jgi:hypothetical protein
MANPFQPDRVDDATIHRNFDRLQTLLARYEKAVGGFNVYRNAAVSYATGSVVVFDTELFDYSGWYDTATGKYTPLIAGLYQFSWLVTDNNPLGAADRYWLTHIRKNGTIVGDGQLLWQRSTQGPNSGGSMLLEANGSTDYFEITVEHNEGAAEDIDTGQDSTFFCGHYVGGKP